MAAIHKLDWQKSDFKMSGIHSVTVLAWLSGNDHDLINGYEKISYSDVAIEL